MLALRLLEEGENTQPDISWLVWVVLAIFVLMVFLGWMASSKGWLKPEEEPVQPHDHDHDDHGHGHEEAKVVVVNHEEGVVAPVAAVSLVETEAAAPARDDLTTLEGIGPKVSKLLEDAGITTFKQLAEADPVKAKEKLDAAGYSYMDPVGWVEQAKLAAVGDTEGLAKLQAELKGGRRRA